nr:MAG TPA: hypothetical protein [Caudoviricetes sp.]
MLKSREIDRLRSDVAHNCRVLIQRCAAEGLPVAVVETVRDLEYQTSLYAQGRTKPGKIVTNQKTPSFHWDKVGLAFDICKNVKGHEYDDADFFRKCGAIGKEMGFTWGGDWKSLPDRPHFQWDDGGRFTASMVRKKQLPRLMPLYREVKAVTKDEAKSILKSKAGLSDATIVYLDSYRYGDDLIVKLAQAVEK